MSQNIYVFQQMCLKLPFATFQLFVLKASITDRNYQYPNGTLWLQSYIQAQLQ